MSRRQMTPEEFAQAVDSEGSLSYALVGYGLGSKDLEPGSDLHALMVDFEESGALDKFRALSRAIDDLLDDFGTEPDGRGRRPVTALAMQEAQAFEERESRRVGNDGLTDVERDAYLRAWQNKYAARPSTDAELNPREDHP